MEGKRVDIQRAFPSLKRIELGLAELYRWYSERFAHDAEAAFVFKRLSLDEKAHAAMLDYQKKIVQANQELSAVKYDCKVE